MAINSVSISKKATLLAASSLTVMSGATIAPALPSIEAAFGKGEQTAFWVGMLLTIPALAIALMAPAMGWVLDRFGRKPVMIAGLVLYTVAGGSGLVLKTLPALIAGRFLLGVAVAGIMTSSTTLIGDYFSGEGRSNFMGLQASFMAAGGIAFPLTGGFLADMHWRAPFAVYLAAAAILPGAIWALKEPRDHDGHTWVEEMDPNAPVPFAKAGVIYLTALAVMAIFYMVPVKLAYYIEDSLGLTASAAGGMIAIMSVGSSLSASQYGKIKRRLGYVGTIGLAFTIIGGAYVMMGSVGTVALVCVAMFLIGPGIGVVMPNLNTWTVTILPKRVRGRGVGVLSTCIFLGQFLALPTAAVLLAASGGLGPMYAAAGVIAMVVGAGFWVASTRYREGRVTKA